MHCPLQKVYPEVPTFAAVDKCGIMAGEIHQLGNLPSLLN